jgi:hypothetical protein
VQLKAKKTTARITVGSRIQLTLSSQPLTPHQLANAPHAEPHPELVIVFTTILQSKNQVQFMPKLPSFSVGDLRERLQRESVASRRSDLIDLELCPPEPQLLDTCIAQNLDWVDRQIEAHNGRVDWGDAEKDALDRRFGTTLADDLLDLGTLYTEFEYRVGYPWVVCSAAIDEAGAIAGTKGAGVRQMLNFIIGHQEEFAPGAFPGVHTYRPLERRSHRVSPLILRAIGVQTPEEVSAKDGPLRFLPDRGDRLTTTAAILSNIPIILTNDRRTFWCHRHQIQSFGVTVMRPSELLNLYLPYWEFLDDEFRRRREEDT